jgi:hypothetical protein
MSVVVPSSEVLVTSAHPRHSVRLNNDGHSDIPRGHDIVSFVLEDIPDHLVKVHVHIGNGHAITFDKVELVEHKNLFPQSFPMSLSWGLYVDIVLEFDKEYALANEVTEMVDEYEEVVEHSDTEEEFYDHWSEEYRHGSRVHRKQVPTGRKISKVVERAKVMTPRLVFDTVESERDVNKGSFILPVWESITINPVRDDEEYVQSLVDKYKLHIPGSEANVVEMLKGGKPFDAKIENLIRFTGGFAGKCYVF